MESEQNAEQVSWLNMILMYAIQAEIDLRDGHSPLDVLQNLQVFIEDRIVSMEGDFSNRVKELQDSLRSRVEEIRRSHAQENSDSGR